ARRHVLPRPGQERDDESQAGHRGQQEPVGHRALRALLGLGALDRPRVLVADQLDAVELGAQPDQVVPAHAVQFCLGGQLLVAAHALLPIHRVTPTSAAMPTIQPMRPSEIGPRPPSALPPGLLLPSVTDLMYVMMSFFS